MTMVTRFSSVEAMEQTIPGMEEGLRAAMPQLGAVLAERSASSCARLRLTSHLVAIERMASRLRWTPNTGGPEGCINPDLGFFRTRVQQIEASA
jgi:hypothetical protein